MGASGAAPPEGEGNPTEVGCFAFNLDMIKIQIDLWYLVGKTSHLVKFHSILLFETMHNENKD